MSVYYGWCLFTPITLQLLYVYIQIISWLLNKIKSCPLTLIYDSLFINFSYLQKKNCIVLRLYIIITIPQNAIVYAVVYC